MREFIESLHAIWDCWYEGKPLLYEGEHYNYRLMTPEFTPENQEYGRPEVMLAAVGPLMQKTAAAVADGMIIHPFCTEKYLKEEMLPSLEQELAQNGKSLENFKIQYPVFIATGETEEQLHTSKEAIRYRIGYYASTPSYKGVLDVHGWGEIQPILNRLTKEGKWDELSSHVTDEMLETFAAVGTPTEAAQIIKDRFGGYIDRVKVEPDYAPEVLEQQLAILRG
jgi:probable F420-dependent oxidoreductase